MAQDLKVVGGGDADEQFFADHPDRLSHIRNANPHELNGEFWSLGPHDSSRRRILIWRVPDYHPLKTRYPLLRIPFLAFADETIEDEDRVLLPLIHEVMMNAAKQGGKQ
jgi:hypothetical protein